MVESNFLQNWCWWWCRRRRCIGHRRPRWWVVTARLSTLFQWSCSNKVKLYYSRNLNISINTSLSLSLNLSSISLRAYAWQRIADSARNDVSTRRWRRLACGSRSRRRWRCWCSRSTTQHSHRRQWLLFATATRSYPRLNVCWRAPQQKNQTRLWNFQQDCNIRRSLTDRSMQRSWLCA